MTDEAKGRMDRINFGRPTIDTSAHFFDCKVDFLVRYGHVEDWTEISVLVHLPKQNYTISELKDAAIAKAKDSLSVLHQAGYEVSPPSPA